jgi:hypothetical protein
MDDQQAREQLLAELQRHGLPRNYIQRLLDELDDHLADLQDERNSDMNTARKPDLNQTDSKASESSSPDIVNLQDRLGDPTQLAAFAAKQYHNRSFFGRHPILTFLVMPLPLILLGMWVVVLAIFLLGHALDAFFPAAWQGTDAYDSPFAEYIGGALFFWLLLILPTLGTGLFLCRISRRNHLKWKWAILMCVVVSLFCGNMYICWHMSPLQERMQHCRMAFGFWIPWLTPYPRGFLYEHLLPQFALAMALGLLLIKRAQRLQKIDENRAEATVLRRAA